jgi:hypothetical protein
MLNTAENRLETLKKKLNFTKSKTFTKNNREENEQTVNEVAGEEVEKSKE